MSALSAGAGAAVELVELEGRGLGLVALCELGMGETVVSEAPIYSAKVEHFSRPEFMGRPEVERLMKIVDAGCDRRGRYSGPALEAMDALVDLHAVETIEALGGERRRRVWDLEDCFRRPVPGNEVRVEGLSSDAGKALNGLYGIVKGRDGARCKVKMADASFKSLKPSNLKTAGGIFRTNAYFHDDDGHVFETASRMNHACLEAANTRRSMAPDGKLTVTTTRPVNKGEELTVSYISSDNATLDTAQRRNYLQNKYQFKCACAKCGADTAKPTRRAPSSS